MTYSRGYFKCIAIYAKLMKRNAWKIETGGVATGFSPPRFQSQSTLMSGHYVFIYEALSTYMMNDEICVAIENAVQSLQSVVVMRKRICHEQDDVVDIYIPTYT